MLDLDVTKIVLESSDGMTITDMGLPDNPLIFVNPAFEKMTGYSSAECIGKNCRFLQGSASNNEDELTIIREAIKNRKPCLVTFKNYRKDGSIFWNELSLSPISDASGKVTHYLGIQKDVTARVLSQKTLETTAENLSALKAAVDEHAIVSIANAAGDITHVNQKFCEISGYAREELLGNNHKIVKSNEHPKAFFVDMWKTIANGKTWHGDIKNVNKNGDYYWVRTTIVPTLNEKGRPKQYIGIRTEITERKRAEDKLKHIAYHDVLTQLPNRSFITQQLTQAMQSCQQRDRSLIVAFLDLDGFKAVNDTYGHHAGDKLLLAMADRMRTVTRDQDILARIGGDEFIVVITDLEEPEESEVILKRLLDSIAEPITLGGNSIAVSASIGCTVYPQETPDIDADQLIRHADQAMYSAKIDGKNRYHLFDAAHDKAMKVKRQIAGEIATALSNHEFVLHYQPKVNLRTGEFIGVEALIRWQHPEQGIIPPLQFLPSIEDDPISLEVGEWVINTALSQISQWQVAGLNVPISVNVSAYQLTQENFPDRLRTLLAAHPDVEPSKLELEILESSILSDVNHVSDIIKNCHEIGVSFALDDFGTGYSSLTHVRRLPAQMIKIDQSFVRDMLEDADDLAIIESVIALAKSFKRDVIAEGVETVKHGEAILQLGCELAQGYGIAKPMPANDIPAWASSWETGDSWRLEDHTKPVFRSQTQ